MNAFQLMKKDHEKVTKLMAEIEKTSEEEADKRTTLFDELKIELDAHTHMEEQVFYPVIDQHKVTHDIALEAYQEHHVVKLLLKELEKMQKNSEEWLAKFVVLKENIDHHVEEEEEEMFKKTRTYMSEDQAEKLGNNMETAKEEFMANIKK